jgi:hypothetical protein
MIEFFKSSVGVMIIAFFMLLGGIIVPFLMMLNMLESTFLLNFIAYFLSMGGLIMGVIGVSMHWQPSSRDREDNYYDY